MRIANTVYIIITGTFVLSLNNFVFQKLSKLKANNLSQDFNLEIKNTLENIFYFLTPLTFVLLIFNREIISILFERGQFDIDSTILTSRALFFYSFGIIGYGIQVILNSGFYANKNGIVPLISSILGVIINFILSFVLVKFLDIGGPALASSISISFVALFMFFVSQKNNRQLLNKKFYLDIAKILFASLCMSGILFFARNLFFVKYSFNVIYKLLFLGIINLFGLLTYVLIGLFFKIKQSVFIKNMIFSKKQE